MALSERSLRDLRKIADLDAKTEASNAAKAVADRRATALQDALAERAVERVNPLTPQSWSFRVLQWKILRQQKPARRALRCRASAF